VTSIMKEVYIHTPNTHWSHVTVPWDDNGNWYNVNLKVK
jgi:hypothetical protein